MDIDIEKPIQKFSDFSRKEIIKVQRTIKNGLI